MTVTNQHPGRRVILVFWKDKKDDPFEVFSNLKVFCESYPSYSYNTLNNYLSKGRKAFENGVVRVERKGLITRPVAAADPGAQPFKMIRAVRKGVMKEIDQGAEDLEYWLSRSSRERMAAVTFIVSQSLRPGERMDKTVVVKRKLKDDDVS